ncbi:hypothetical protein C0Q70_14295 [Pomacea canaliculata]|uniref:CUB domain-containing protein n=1 Tax=Pomacea canaliculata TaxID=400727 RepID=A0A2T7NZM3_POMCA|nr:hypothetical protein C0Q70_14295 [Pomacea canaliculata]
MGAGSVLTTSFLLLGVSGVHMRCPDRQRPRMLIAHPYISAPIGSHTYPYHTYPNNSSCEWLISADTGYVVRLTLLLVDLQESDTIIIIIIFNFIRGSFICTPGNSRNSRQLGAFCSQRLSNGRSVDSSLRWLYVELKADDADSKGRFLFTYEAVQPQLSTTLGEKHAARAHTHTGSLNPSLHY